MYRTDAHALQAILRELNNAETGGSLQARWFKVLGSRGLGAEFVRRHAEVVALLESVIRQIATLPESSRANYEPSTVPWWQAIVAPDVSWGSGASSALIGDEHIRSLGALGDVLEFRLEATSAAPVGKFLDELKAQCAEWAASLENAGLPAGFRNLIAEGINHLTWLIENADRFGYARVAQAAEAVTGQLVMATPQVPEPKRATWTERLTKWTAVLAAYSAFMGGTHMAIETTKVVVRDIESTVATVTDIVDGEIVDDDSEEAS